VIRCCANGSGQTVDFSHVTQGRQVIWGHEAVSRAGGWRSTVVKDRWPYGMGIWAPATLTVSVTADSPRLSIAAVGVGLDRVTPIPLRHGAMYYLFIPGAGRNGTCLRGSFKYDAGRPLDAQELSEPVGRSVTDATARIINATFKGMAKDQDPIAIGKIDRHFGWSLMLCGNDNDLRVSADTYADRERRVLDFGNRNRVRSLGTIVDDNNPLKGTVPAEK
jgi:hypothetical protein